MTNIDNFFGQDELLEEFEFRKDMLPTKHEVLLYVVSRTNKGNKVNKVIVNEMAKQLEEIWEKADCCPFTMKYIARLYDQEIWKPYLHLRREKCLPGSGAESIGSKRSHKKDPAKTKERLDVFTLL